jgi:hypothetical protein
MNPVKRNLLALASGLIAFYCPDNAFDRRPIDEISGITQKVSVSSKKPGVYHHTPLVLKAGPIALYEGREHEYLLDFKGKLVLVVKEKILLSNTSSGLEDNGLSQKCRFTEIDRILVPGYVERYRISQDGSPYQGIASSIVLPLQDEDKPGLEALLRQRGFAGQVAFWN